MAAQLVVKLQHVGKSDGKIVGGKGASLGEMIQAGFPVSPGFVVTTDAYSVFLQHNNLREKIQHLLGTIDFAKPASLEQTAQLIKKRIMDGLLPESFVAEVFKEYTKLGKAFSDAYVAVRSSATAEDLSEASFVDQQESYCNIQGEANLLLAIKEVWASLFHARAIFYRHEKGLDHLQVKIAVVVQKMINAQNSGVLFALNPVTNDKSVIVIEAIFGVEEYIVQGEVTPDHYEVDKQSFAITNKILSQQEKQLIRKGYTDKSEKLASEKGRQQKITDKQIIALAHLAKKVEQHYFFSQEIIWAIEDNHIFFLDAKLLITNNKKSLIKNEKLQINTDTQEIFIEPSLQTATKLYVNLAQPELATQIAKRHVDGVGLLRANVIMTDIGIHPKKAIQEHRQKAYIQKLAEGISSFCAAFSPRPIVYCASDLQTNDYRHLQGGEQFELVEPNPALGYRGAFRHIHDPEVFELELTAIREVRHKMQLKNLWLMLPFVRSVEELTAVKKLIAAAGLYRTPSFKIWMMVETPANVILLDDFISVGIDGISINSSDLTMLLLGVDRNNNDIVETLQEENPAALWAFEKIIKTAHKHNITVSFCGQAISQNPDLVEKLVKWGITSVSVTPDAITTTRQVIADTEKKLLM